MSTYVRRLVSGPKARHVDKKLNVDLDLVYITDRLIIMGWPASKFEALYRNSRKDVRRFLDAKHGEKYRVYNLCPCGENSYDASEFYGAVSRYPFPDHHPPPLSLIPMFVCDITAWLADDPENVAVIHCKAGKGRSGTMACCYLLSLPFLPAEKPILGGKSPRESSPSSEDEKSPAADKDIDICADGRDAIERSYTVDALSERLQAVFEMHTARRLKPQRTGIDESQHAFLNRDPSSSQERSRSSSVLDVHRLGEEQLKGDQALSHQPKRSVSGLLRKASRGILRHTGGNGKMSGDSNVPNSNPITPSRSRRASSSLTHADASSAKKAHRSPCTIGVNPKGRSMVDLSQMLKSDQIPPMAPSSPSLRRRKSLQMSSPNAAVVQGFGASASDLLAGRMASAGSSPSGTSRTPTPSANIDPDYFSSRAISPTLGQRLAPPLFRPGERIAALSQSRTGMHHYHSSPENSSSFSFGQNPQSDEEYERNNDVTLNGIDDEEEEIMGATQQPLRLAVSIPSQRRFVGYWARILANLDPRLPLTPYGSIAPRRTVRITHISIDRRVTGDEQPEQSDASAPSSKRNVALSIQLGRYDSQIEKRLHQWEVNARRRTRAFGYTDPSGCAPTLPPDELEDHGTDFKGPARRKQERDADMKRWQSAVDENGNGGYERKTSQHGNKRGVGCWGINVLAEQERARFFKWCEGNANDDLFDKIKLKQAMKGEMKIEHFVNVQESAVIKPNPSSNRWNATQSSVNISSKVEKTNTGNAQTAFARHEFNLSDRRGTNVTYGSAGLPTWLTGRARRDDDGNDVQLLDVDRVAEEASFSTTGDRRPSYAVSSSDTSPSGSSMWAHHSSDRAKSGKGDAGERMSPTPLTSVESLRGAHSSSENSKTKQSARTTTDSSEEEGARVRLDDGHQGGVIVDADSALQIKVLSGRSGATHSKLPDITSCGYVWFIPSFEQPTPSPTVQQQQRQYVKPRPKCGERVRCSFPANEIDFRKRRHAAKLVGAELCRVIVEFEWVEIGDDSTDHEAEEDAAGEKETQEAEHLSD